MHAGEVEYECGDFSSYINGLTPQLVGDRITVLKARLYGLREHHAAVRNVSMWLLPMRAQALREIEEDICYVQQELRELEEEIGAPILVEYESIPV